MDKSEAIGIIISVLWGVGLAVLFRKTCINDQCVVVKVPLEFGDTSNIIRNDGRCYQLQPYVYPCRS